MRAEWGRNTGGYKYPSPIQHHVASIPVADETGHDGVYGGFMDDFSSGPRDDYATSSWQARLGDDRDDYNDRLWMRELSESRLPWGTWVDSRSPGAVQVYPEMWLTDAALLKDVAKVALRRGLFRHSPLWKARRVLSRVPAEQAKIRYAHPSVNAVIPPARGTSRVYRGSGVDAMADLGRNGVLSSPHGYDLHSRGLYGYQGWRGQYDDYWGSFPESVRQDILRQMRGKTLVTDTADSAAQFYRGGDGKYIHVYDIPKRAYEKLRWTYDAGQQRGILEYAKKALSEGKPVGKIPSSFGVSLPPGRPGYETVVDRSLLRDAYAGSVHQLNSYSPLKEGTWLGDPLYRHGSAHENRLARLIGMKLKTRHPRSRVDPIYDMSTYYRDPGDIKMFSPVDDTLARMRRLEESGWKQTWLDWLTEMVSPTVQR